jgi:hydrogenase maturation protein HypF
VAKTAARFAVTGFCGNDDESVFIEAQGEAAVVERFLDAVVAEAPPLARVLTRQDRRLGVVAGESGFRIVASRRAPGAVTLISPDVATCADCLRDMADPSNRRFHYPFTTCTNCGPRLSIIRDVPYDRPLTTMADFPMCEACRAEYEDPADRRYHAQPISCFDCGPRLWLEAAEGERRPAALDDADPISDMARALEDARGLLVTGKVVAVKGIGGFTLMCDARDEAAVATLRRRKRRPGKPLAVMAGSLDAARRIAELGPEHVRELTSPQRPIVLAPMSKGYDLAGLVAPGLDDIGVMLPYSPVHHLLLRPGDVFVATSANSSSLPLTHTNADARRDLAGIVDAFLMHDRGIHVPVEDSVVQATAEGLSPIRRSRGYAPLPVPLGDRDRPLLAVGGELKNTFALVRNGMAFLSAHIGDMGSLETQAAFEKSVRQLLTTHRRSPELIVADKHPGYATRAWGRREAERLGVPLLEVQHHLAHALSLLAEQRASAVAGGRPLQEAGVYLVCDGTGYGDDGAIWGGELLVLGDNPLDYTRAWHLPEFWLPGGDAAVQHPWRCAIALLREHGLDADDLPCASAAPPQELAAVRSQLDAQVAVVRTTSTGRVFDAVASLLGVCHNATYEAQAAMELEALARRCDHPEHGPALSWRGGLPELLERLATGLREGAAAACLARLFHSALAAICVAEIDAPSAGLTGGVFANRLFTAEVRARLAARGCRGVTHRIVPPNDGGLALGQALAGYLTLEGAR